MHHLKNIKKVLTFLTCAAISAGILASPAADMNKSDPSAMTIAEIQEQRKANEAKIADLEYQINNLEGDKNFEKQQQEYLEAQVKIIQENINLLNAELKSIGDDIAVTEATINNLDIDIVNQQTSIDENIELFKQRLCVMYMSGSDTSASIVLGSSSFYDIMSRVQMINAIAEYDDKLINDILGEIDALEKSKNQLESEKLILDMKLDEQKKRKEEKAAEIEVLNDKMKETEYEIKRIAREQDSLARDKSVLEAENAAWDAEIAAIQAEIQRQAEEAQRRWEEEQRKQQQALYNQNTGNGGEVSSPSYAPVYTTPNVAASGFAWPAPGFSYITSYYGYRWGRNHNGIDIGDGGIGGGTAVASQSGTVVTVYNSCTHNFPKDYSCGCGGGFGNYVVISHDGQYSTLYGHLAYATVSVGDYVQQGQGIGAIGSTGHSTGAHLHFEVWEYGAPYNPMNYVSP